MKRKQSSITAQGIAAIRAVESSKPPAQRICYDPLARQLVGPLFYYLTKLFAGYGGWRAPGTIEYILARTRYMDDYLRACLDGGIEQLVILGGRGWIRGLTGLNGSPSASGPSRWIVW